MNQLIAELNGLVEDLARDGNAGADIVASAAQQLEQLQRAKNDHDLTMATLEDIIDDSHRSDRAKVLAIQSLLRKEAQP